MSKCLLCNGTGQVPDVQPVNVGHAVKVSRDAMGLSQADFSKAIGYESSTAISLIENGKRNITVETLLKIAAITGREPAYFLTPITKTK